MEVNINISVGRFETEDNNSSCLNSRVQVSVKGAEDISGFDRFAVYNKAISTCMGSVLAGITTASIDIDSALKGEDGIGKFIAMKLIEDLSKDYLVLLSRSYCENIRKSIGIVIDPKKMSFETLTGDSIVTEC